MIIGTAGHIDHGKTTLVRALTGVDTDRLKEEKARGISIELGYAYRPLPGSPADAPPEQVLGFIDVPGHERFVHTMAAGAVGIDHALLVVAADDGVMPQTREHLAILRLLGVASGTVALTKVDRVDPAQVQVVRRDLAQLLADTPLARAAVFETCAPQADDLGVAALLAHLVQQARVHPTRRNDGLFRLAVDRVFTLAGQGTVVTGTVFGGRVRVGDMVQVSGNGRLARVRALHAQSRAAGASVAGQRCALNLAGVDRDEITRGDWVADPGALQASQRVDVALTLLSDAAPLPQWSAVHVHAGTAHRTAHVALLQEQPVPPGGRARVQLVFERPVHLLPGDHFIVRNAQASRTLGGGQVLDPFAPERKRRSPARMAQLDALEVLLRTGEVSALLVLAPEGELRSRLSLLSGRRLQDPPAGPDWVALPAGGDDALWLSRGAWQQAQARVLDALARHHERHPDEPGVNRARLRRMALPDGREAARQDSLWQGVLAALLAEGRVQAQGAWLHLPGHVLRLDATEVALGEQLLAWLTDGGWEPPWVRDLAARSGVAEERVRGLLHKLARHGLVFQVVKDLFFTEAAVQALSGLVAHLAQAHARGEVAAREFRDASGLGRKRAIQVLEFFDRVGHTRRLRDAHVLRSGPGWPQAVPPPLESPRCPP